MNSAELRERLCQLYKAQSVVEKDILEAVRSGNQLALDSATRNITVIDRRIGEINAEIAEAEANTPQDQRILDAELLVMEKLGYANGARARHADALAEVEAADDALNIAVEAAKGVIGVIAEEKPDLRGKIGETGIFQIARGMKYETVKVGEGVPTVTVKFVKAALDSITFADVWKENTRE